MDSVTVNVLEKGELFIPTVFTPNGDGTNDLFLIFGKGIASIYLTIYNRWGEKIFHSDDIARGWDGTWNEKEQPVGIYTYTVQGKYTDNTAFNQTGTVLLLK